MIHLKKLRKFFALTLTTIMVTLPLSAEASSTVPSEQKSAKPIFEEVVIPNSIVEVNVNEYDEVMKLKSLTDEELTSLGCDNEEIDTLRNFNYEEELKERLKKDKLDLNNYINKDALSKNSVANIKDIDLSEELTPTELRALSATLTLRSGINSIESNATNWRLYYEWTWSSSPTFLWTDIIGVRALGTVNGANATPTIMNSSFAMTNYFYKSTDKWDGEYMSNFEKVDIGASQAKFSMARWILEESRATSGYGYVVFNHSKPMERLAIALQYGHSAIGIKPSMSITLPGSVKFGFSPATCTTETSVIKTYDRNGNVVQ